MYGASKILVACSDRISDVWVYPNGTISDIGQTLAVDPRFVGYGSFSRNVPDEEAFSEYTLSGSVVVEGLYGTSSFSFISPLEFCLADFDRDFKPDLAVVEFENDAVRIFQNNSVNSLSTPSFSAWTVVLAGDGPVSICHADFNENDKEDLAVANFNSSNVYVLENKCLDYANWPSFTTQSYAVGPNPKCVRAADFDGDGKPDLVTCDFGGAVSILRNTSGIVISFAPKVDVGTGWFGSPSWMCVDDFDSDGKPDIAVTNSGWATITILRNTSTRGSISFEWGGGGVVGLTPWSICSGDFNFDGKPDLAVANNSSHSVSVLLNTTSTSGSGGGVCGDANCDLFVDISDVVYLIAYIFSGGLKPCAACK